MAKKKDKWEFAIGTTSRVPHSTLHYFIADFDVDKIPFSALRYIADKANNITVQRTPNGFHLYSDWKLSFNTLIEKLKECSADATWIRIGQARGYFFLADKNPVVMSWPVERMILSGKKRKEKHSTGA